MRRIPWVTLARTLANAAADLAHAGQSAALAEVALLTPELLTASTHGRIAPADAASRLRAIARTAGPDGTDALLTLAEVLDVSGGWGEVPQPDVSRLRGVGELRRGAVA